MLAELLARFQKAGELRSDFDPRAVAIAIRAAIDAAPARLSADPQFDIDAYAQNIIQVFDLATRTTEVGAISDPDGAGRDPPRGEGHVLMGRVRCRVDAGSSWSPGCWRR